MPTVKEYKHDPGYYIRARPPDTGNINYKIKSEAYPIIEGCGLRHEDEITWDMIRSMKSLGFIYTKGSGVLEVGDFEPDPDQLEETSLSEQQAKALLSTIQEHHDLTQDQLETICSILGIEVPRADIDQLEDSLDTTITPLVQTERFPLSTTLDGYDCDDLSVRTMTSDIESSNRVVMLHVVIYPDNLITAASSGGFVLGKNIPKDDYLLPTEGGLIHNISISQEEGISDWIVGIEDDITWAIRSEIMHQIGHLIPVIVEKLESTGIDPGDPENVPAPFFDSFNI